MLSTCQTTLSPFFKSQSVLSKPLRPVLAYAAINQPLFLQYRIDRKRNSPGNGIQRCWSRPAEGYSRGLPRPQRKGKSAEEGKIRDSSERGVCRADNQSNH
jgi:hypothetical protein